MFFRNHVLTSCHHEARALAVSCRLCQLKSDRQDEKDRQSEKDGESASQSAKQKNQDKDQNTHHFVNAKAILGHIYDSHIRIFFKCSFCPKAFVDKSAIYDHKQVLISFHDLKRKVKIMNYTCFFKIQI